MQAAMHIAFAGTPDLAVSILKSLLDSGKYTVDFVLTQPDRPAGRGKIIRKSPVKELAEQCAIPVYQPVTKEQLDQISSLGEIDLLVVAAYGLIITEKVLALPRLGCVNVHTSLLPRWRGAAPIQHAILAGDLETGITIMQMDTGLDTGDILFQKTCPIEQHETAGSLHEKLALLGSECLLMTLDQFRTNSVKPRRQDESQATYAGKINKQDGEIDWSRPAREIHRQIRAMNPSPVAHTCINGIDLRVWESEPSDGVTRNHPPGAVVQYDSKGLEIAAGEGSLMILRLQIPGKKALSFHDFYNGNPGLLAPGDA